MFGLFKQPIGDQELFELIFMLLVNLRTEFKADNAKYDAAIKDLRNLVDLACNSAKKKLTPNQRGYVQMACMSCELNLEMVRSVIDRILAIVHLPAPTQTQVNNLHTLRDEIDDYFRSYGADWRRMNIISPVY